MTKFCLLRAPNIHYCTVYMSQLLSLKWNSVKLNSFQLDFSLSHNSIIQPFFQAFINYNFLCTWEIVPMKERTCTLLIITWHGCSKCTKLVLKPLAAKNGRSISVLCTDFSPYIRDDTHMPSMKIIQFSRPHTPLVHLPRMLCYVQYSSTPLTLDVQFQVTPLLLQMITSQLKENNPRMNIICYQVLPSGQFSFSASTH